MTPRPVTQASGAASGGVGGENALLREIRVGEEGASGSAASGREEESGRVGGGGGDGAGGGGEGADGGGKGAGGAGGVGAAWTGVLFCSFALHAAVGQVWRGCNPV